MAKTKVKLQGTQWPMAIGGGGMAVDILDGDLVINQLQAGAILDKTDLLILEAFDGTTPTIAVAMQDLDGTNEVVLQVATAATSVTRVTTQNGTLDRILVPKQIVLKGVATDSTVGKAWADVTTTVPGKSDGVSS